MASSSAVNHLSYKAHPFYQRAKPNNEMAAAPVYATKRSMFPGVTYVPKGTGITNGRVEALTKKYELKPPWQMDLSLEEAELVIEVSKAREELPWPAEFDRDLLEVRSPSAFIVL
jgi:hypothetical protein